MPGRARRYSAVSCAKMAAPIVMPFGWWTRVNPRKLVLGGVHTGATWRIQLSRPCAAAMRTFVKLLFERNTFNLCRPLGPYYELTVLCIN